MLEQTFYAHDKHGNIRQIDVSISAPKQVGDNLWSTTHRYILDGVEQPVSQPGQYTRPWQSFMRALRTLRVCMQAEFMNFESSVYWSESAAKEKSQPRNFDSIFATFKLDHFEEWQEPTE